MLSVVVLATWLTVATIGGGREMRYDCQYAGDCPLGDVCFSDSYCRSGNCVDSACCEDDGCADGSFCELAGDCVDLDGISWRCGPEPLRCTEEPCDDGQGLCDYCVAADRTPTCCQPLIAGPGLCAPLTATPITPGAPTSTATIQLPTPTPDRRAGCGCPVSYIGGAPLCIAPPHTVVLGCKPEGDNYCVDCCGDVWDCTWTCPGDCNGNKRVGIEELTTAVNVFLGTRPLRACSNADAGRDDALSVDELIRAVRSALEGCE